MTSLHTAALDVLGPSHRERVAELLAARYGAAAPEVPATWNDVLTVQLGHRAVRAYSPDPLPAGVLESAICAAQSAASSSNLQLWSVVAVEDPDRKARLAELAGGQAHIRQAPLLLVWIADLARAGQIAGGRNAATGNIDYLESFLTAAVDAALAAQNAVIALESLGLGTVYIGAMRNQPERVAAELRLPPLAAPLFGLLVGRPDAAAPTTVKPRLGQSAVLHHETYSLDQQNEAIRRYDAILADYQLGQGRNPNGWTAAVVDQVSRLGALYGRERLREALNALGFQLK